jgi:hypothetical protein
MGRIGSHMKDRVKGSRIRYVTLERCKLKEQVDWLERELIRQYLPELNIIRYEDAT